MAIAPLRVPVTGDDVLLRSVLGRARRNIRGFAAGATGDIGGVHAATRKLYSAFVALGALRLGKQVLDDFVSFDESLTRIETLVGVNRDQVAAWRQDLIEMGPAVAKGPGELADAMFFITSAGLRGEKALSALRAAAKGSAIGLGETKTVADAATSAVNAYASSNLSAEQSVAVLAATIREGKLETDAVAGAIGTALPLASKLGVRFDEVGAAMAAMSKTGTDASEAVTQLNSIFTTTLQPTTEAVKTLARVNLTVQDLRRSLAERGLLATLKDLNDRFHGNVDAMASVFGNVRALRGVFNILGDNIADTERIFAELAGTVGGDLDQAFNRASESGSFKYRQSIAELNTEMAKLGERVAPAMIAALKGLTDNLETTAVVAATLLGIWVGLRGGPMGAAIGGIVAGGGMAGWLRTIREEAEAALAATEKLKVSTTQMVGSAPILPGGLTPPASAATTPPPPGLPVLSEDAEKARKKIEEVIAALKFEEDQLGRTAREQEVYNALVQAGIDPQHAQAAAVRAAAESLYDKEQSTQAAVKAEKDLETALGELGDFGQGILDSLIDGTFDWRDALKAAIPIIVNLLTSMQALSAAGGGNPLLAALGLGGMGGGGPTYGIGTLYHRGGIAGGPGSGRRRVPSAAFSAAQRMHDGGIAGLMPNEVPAILKRGEPVFPNLAAASAFGGVNVTFAPTYNVRGSGPEIDRLRADMATDRQQFKGRVVEAVREGQSRRALR